MPIKEIFCQDKAIGILQSALARGRVPHAYIFAGIEGVGKYTTAREWAKVLLCDKPTVEAGRGGDFADSCGSCQSCQLFEGGSHPDFNHVYKELVKFTEDGKGKEPPVDLPIDVVREFLVAKVSTRPTLSHRKVFVVSEAERLNNRSQNALLKVLEEPPEYCCIILLCTRMEKLLATTKSRCQTVRFGPVAEEKIVEKLKEIGIEPTTARYFARLGQGSLGRPCQWATLELAGVQLYQTKRQLLESLANCKYADTLKLAQWVLDQTKAIAAGWFELDKSTSKTDISRRARKTLVHMVISALHDAMNLNISRSDTLANFDQQNRIEALARHFDCEHAAEKVDLCYETLRWIDASVNEKLIFERLLLNLAASATINAQH